MIRTSLFAFVIVACAVASPSGAQTPGELLQKGIYTQNTVGDFDAAIAIFRQLLVAATSPRRYGAEAHAHIVQCLAAKGDGGAAAREFNLLASDYAEFKDVVSAAAAVLRGRVTSRQSIQLANGPTRILSAIRGRVTDDRGRVADLLGGGPLQNGRYLLKFHTGDYFRAKGEQSFHPEVSVMFEVGDSAQHYHVPLLLSAFGYSTYRGS